jgi:hypothetical protein
MRKLIKYRECAVDEMMFAGFKYTKMGCGCSATHFVLVILPLDARGDDPFNQADEEEKNGWEHE